MTSPSQPPPFQRARSSLRWRLSQKLETAISKWPKNHKCLFNPPASPPKYKVKVLEGAETTRGIYLEALFFPCRDHSEEHVAVGTQISLFRSPHAVEMMEPSQSCCLMLPGSNGLINKGDDPLMRWKKRVLNEIVLDSDIRSAPVVRKTGHFRNSSLARLEKTSHKRLFNSL